MSPTAVVSSSDLTKWLLLCVGVQPWVSRVKSRGMRTHSLVVGPVFRMMVLEALLPTRTACGLLVSVVLKAELNSKNSILTYESFVSRWVRAEWRTAEIATTALHIYTVKWVVEEDGYCKVITPIRCHVLVPSQLTIKVVSSGHLLPPQTHSGEKSLPFILALHSAHDLVDVRILIRFLSVYLLFIKLNMLVVFLLIRPLNWISQTNWISAEWLSAECSSLHSIS